LVAAVASLVASALALWLLPAEVHHGRHETHHDDTRLDGQPDGQPVHAGTLDMDVV